MIMIARLVARLAVEEVVRSMGEAIPDALALAIRVPCPFDLISSGGCAP
jgi:hypothetical protein